MQVSPDAQVISASRRTDIPAFYMPWLMKRLDAGSVKYPNPFSGQVYALSTQPEDVHSIVFWSKHYGPFLRYVDALRERDYRFCCHYTITGASRRLEPNVPSWETAVRVFRALANRTSPDHVQWRFDPILITADSDASACLARFRQIADALAGHTRRCYFSFAAFYGKVKQRLDRTGPPYTIPDLGAKRELAARMVEIAHEYHITLFACCQEDLVNEHVRQAHCIDGDLLAALFPDRPGISHPRPTREGCGCVASRDIGIYDTCAFGCAYCYANQDHARAAARQKAHDPNGEMLIATPL